MHNSTISIIFCLIISILSINYSSFLILSEKITNKKIIKLQCSISNENLLKNIPFIINEEEMNSSEIISSIQRLETESIKIKVEDISSKINLNFIDFTLFKEPIFKDMLKDQYTWQSLEEFRNKLSFTGNIDNYSLYFKDYVTFYSLFTTYGLININNSSDLMIERFYLNLTDDSSKSLSFKNIIDNHRKVKNIIDNEELNKIILHYNNDTKKYITTIPLWNINLIDKQLLIAILRKYNVSDRQVLSIRNNKEITAEEIDSLLMINDENKGLRTYLGTKTTFWRIDVIDYKNELKTTLIMGWDLVNKKYRTVSIIKDFL